MSQQETKATILLADDEEDSRFAFQIGLEMNGYEVLISRNGDEVLEQLSAARTDARKIDLVITDLQMPGMTGRELIERVLAFENTPPILVISGFQDESLAEELVRQGCRGYLNKPFTISILTEWIERTLIEIQENSASDAARNGGESERATNDSC